MDTLTLFGLLLAAALAAAAWQAWQIGNDRRDVMLLGAGGGLATAGAALAWWL